MPTTLDSTPYEIPAVNFPRVPAAFGRDGVGMDATMSILDNAMEAQARVMEWRTKMQAAQQFRSSQIQGRQAFGELSQLDPTAPDFLQQRNAVVSKYPDALLDKSAQSFLGLQEDVYIDAKRDENEQWDRRYQMEKEDRYERQAQESAADASVRAIQSRYQKLGAQGREIVESMLNDGTDPSVALDAAERTEIDDELEMELLESGATEEEILMMRGLDATDIEKLKTSPSKREIRRIEQKIGPIRQRAASKWIGERKRQSEQAETSEDAQKDELFRLDRQLKVLDEERKLLLESDGDTTEAESANRKARLAIIERQRQLLGGNIDSSTAGPPDYIRGGTRETNDPGKPTDKKMRDRLDHLFQ